MTPFAFLPRAPRGSVCRAFAFGLCLSSPLAGAQGPQVIRETLGERNTGFSVAGAGDVDRDGCSDYIVATAEGAGHFEVYSGRDSSIIWTFSGIREQDILGYNVSGIGDANNDGYDDVAAMAFGVFNGGQNAGEVFVVSGLTGELLWTAPGDNRDWQWGQNMGPAGDVNRDGFDDLIVGSDRADVNGPFSGTARVYSGLDGRILAEVSGENQFTGVGSDVAGAGDVNFDGYADIIVGASGDDTNGSGRGSATVFSGRDASVLFRFTGDNDFDFLGASVDGGYDANADGVPDFVVGSSFTDVLADRGGSVQVFSGLDGEELWRVDGEFAANSIGDNAAFAGDLNGDGYDDVMVGDPRGGYDGNPNEPGVGYVTIYSGRNGALLWRLEGDFVGDGFGTSICAAGDVNQDGKNDIIVGAPANQMDATELGYARVFGGTRVPFRLLLAVPQGLQANRRSNAYVFGSPPRGTVRLYAGTGRSPSHVLDVGGLDIRQPELIAIGTANKIALTQLAAFVPASLQGYAVWLQAIDGRSATSNVLFTVIR